MKIMFIGAIHAGKTTLIQALQNEIIQYKKTQVVEYNDEYIDTPGEYMQHRMFWYSLTTVANDADIICLLHDATDDDFWFSPGITTKFAKPVIGIITKIDQEKSNIRQAKRYLNLAGCQKIYPVSSIAGIGIRDLQDHIKEDIKDYHINNEYSYGSNYFD